jgi:hypothetical protein
MKTIKFDNQESWKEYRGGKITGSILDDVFSVKEITVADIKSQLDEQGIEYKKSAKREELLALLPEAPQAKLVKKLAFYELLAHKVSVPEDGEEDPMERGTRLEEEALARYAEQQGIELTNDLIVWESNENDSLAYSPDGVVSDEEVVETKCLSSAMHLYIYYEQDIPAKYRKQNLQAFIVNENLQKLHFVCYDPRIAALPLHSITITRDEVADEIALYKQYEVQLIDELKELVTDLTF